MDKCLKAGLRMTSQRVIIVQEINSASDHPNVDTIYRRATEKDPSISLATVYRTVGLLDKAGIIEKLEIGDGSSRYEMAREHHDHLLDIEDGTIHEFQNKVLEELKNKIADEMGFDLVSHRLELYGRKKKIKTLFDK